MALLVEVPPKVNRGAKRNPFFDVLLHQLIASSDNDPLEWVMVERSSTGISLERQRRQLISRLAYRNAKVQTTILNERLFMRLMSFSPSPSVRTSRPAAQPARSDEKLGDITQELLSLHASASQAWIALTTDDLARLSNARTAASRCASLIASLRHRGIRVQSSLTSTNLYLRPSSILQEVRHV